MRIAQIMLGKGFGGAERSYVDLCAALRRRGHDVLAVCETRAAARGELERTTDLEPAPITVRGPWDPFARRRLKRLLARFRPQIVQMHLARAATLAGPAARALRIPSLAKTHNYVDLKYYRAIDHLVATTAKQRDYLAAHGVSGARLSVIPNFSSIPVAAPRQPISAGPLRAVAVGRMVFKKGFDVLFDALARVRARGCPVTLAIAGDGPESDALHDQLGRLGLADAVTFLGWQHDIVPCLENADIFVLPSRDEPFGIVCLEAMACGVPIIATTTDGPMTFLDDDTALLVPPDDPDALAAALLQADADRTAAGQRAAAARDRFVRCYSEEVVVGQYLELYARLVGSDHAGIA